jgi:hypothetical protein
MAQKLDLDDLKSRIWTAIVRIRTNILYAIVYKRPRATLTTVQKEHTVDYS